MKYSSLRKTISISTVWGHVHPHQRRPNAAVKTPDASGKSVNALEVRVAGDTVSYVVNGTVVHTTPKSALSGTDGTVGFRVNHVTEVQVDGFEVQKS